MPRWFNDMFETMLKVDSSACNLSDLPFKECKLDTVLLSSIVAKPLEVLAQLIEGDLPSFLSNKRPY